MLCAGEPQVKPTQDFCSYQYESLTMRSNSQDRGRRTCIIIPCSCREVAPKPLT